MSMALEQMFTGAVLNRTLAGTSCQPSSPILQRTTSPTAKRRGEGADVAAPKRRIAEAQVPAGPRQHRFLFEPCLAQEQHLHFILEVCLGGNKTMGAPKTTNNFKQSRADHSTSTSLKLKTLLCHGLYLFKDDCYTQSETTLQPNFDDWGVQGSWEYNAHQNA